MKIKYKKAQNKKAQNKIIYLIFFGNEFELHLGTNTNNNNQQIVSYIDSARKNDLLVYKKPKVNIKVNIIHDIKNNHQNTLRQ